MCVLHVVLSLKSATEATGHVRVVLSSAPVASKSNRCDEASVAVGEVLMAIDLI